MTASSPPPFRGSYRLPATTTGNGFAIASLICSIFLSCVPFVGGTLGVVFGILGMKRAKITGTGRGMALSGLIIGILALLLWGLFFAKFASKAMASSGPVRAVAREYVIDLSAGNSDAALANTIGMSKQDVSTQIVALKPMGTFQDMTSSSFVVDNTGWTFSGTATFANGTKTYTIKLSGSGANWKVYSAVFQ